IGELFPTFIKNIISRIHLKPCVTSDSLRWLGNRKGEFSVKSVFHLISKHENQAHYSTLNFRTVKLIWKLRHLESDYHLFFECEWIKAVWFASIVSLKVADHIYTDCRQWIELFISWMEADCDDLNRRGLFCLCFLYEIWKHRNYVKFERGVLNMRTIWHNSNSSWITNLEAFRSDDVTIIISASQHNNLFTHTCPHIFYDATYDRVSCKGVVGALCKNEQGAVLGASFTKFKANNAMEAEYIAIELSCKMLRQLVLSL
ncbi:hypothetical protein IFM89_032922, partial [Coptis chinensis]